jgi:hypothetical protein
MSHAFLLKFYQWNVSVLFARLEKKINFPLTLSAILLNKANFSRNDAIKYGCDMSARVLCALAVARLVWLVAFDGYHFYSACQSHLDQCRSYEGDNALFRVECDKFRALGTPLNRTARYIQEQIIDTGGWDFWLLLALLVRCLLSPLYSLLCAHVRTRRVANDNALYERQHCQGSKLSSNISKIIF